MPKAADEKGYNNTWKRKEKEHANLELETLGIQEIQP